MQFSFTVDDVCFEGYSTEDHLTRLLDFLATEKVRATFFVVPLAQGIPVTRRSEYIRILKRAIADGHEVAQHGLEHERFEVGIPPEMILALPHEGPARERLARERQEIEADLQTDKICRRLAQGRQILQDALGVAVVGFRAPCLQICDNLFDALEAEGYHYDSSDYLQPTGWDLLNGIQDAKPRPITRESHRCIPAHKTLRILPLTTEYTWYLKQPMFDLTFALARHDFDACWEARIPFVPLCHVSPIQEGDPDCGFKLYRKLMAFARTACAAKGETLNFVPLTEACTFQADNRSLTVMNQVS